MGQVATCHLRLDMYGTVKACSACIVSSIKSWFPAAIVRHPKDPLTHTSHTGCRLRRSLPQWQWQKRPTWAPHDDRGYPQVESDHNDPSGYPRLPKAAGWGRVPTGLPSGAQCPYPRRESRVVEPNELLHKGSGIKAVFSLAPLPRRPCMRESPCSLGRGVDSSNHQFPRQSDRGQATGGRHPTASASASR